MQCDEGCCSVFYFVAECGNVCLAWLIDMLSLCRVCMRVHVRVCLHVHVCVSVSERESMHCEYACASACVVVLCVCACVLICGSLCVHMCLCACA
mmetsp:Transcript_55860/g.90455  ORF Transcript_55860/g.90455 Transcript_55860/m.90455 type:complete len:95 (-) Transcript_55860:328-612(-)